MISIVAVPLSKRLCLCLSLCLSRLKSASSVQSWSFSFDVLFISVYKETAVLLRFLYFLFDISSVLIITNAFKHHSCFKMHKGLMHFLSKQNSKKWLSVENIFIKLGLSYKEEDNEWKWGWFFPFSGTVSFYYIIQLLFSFPNLSTGLWKISLRSRG